MKTEKYKYHKSSREGEADVYYNGHSLPNLPYHVAEELCTAANEYYSLKQQLSALQQENDKLRKFKKYVHERLDKMGVPADPEPDNNAAHGCRIEGRLNCLESKDKEIAELREKLKKYETVKSCPNCLSDDVIMFTSDLDMCKHCGHQF